MRRTILCLVAVAGLLVAGLLFIANQYRRAAELDRAIRLADFYYFYDDNAVASPGDL